ncbi:histone H3-like [Uranotaenia lowii]|uniref:histone H3-like n=1 Tax=Uranotaenia lowii TaxID=190385 RepID=UPI002479E1AA|nr:histone H3-like [Uranotaenia lowii]
MPRRYTKAPQRLPVKSKPQQKLTEKHAENQPIRTTRSRSRSVSQTPTFDSGNQQSFVERNEKRRRSRSETRPNSRLLKDIMMLQTTTRLLIPKLSFGRVIREVLLEQFRSDMRVTAECLNCLQEAAEIYLVQLMEDSYRCTLHRDRLTLMPKDMQLAIYLRERWER